MRFFSGDFPVISGFLEKIARKYVGILFSRFRRIIYKKCSEKPQNCPLRETDLINKITENLPNFSIFL